MKNLPSTDSLLRHWTLMYTGVIISGICWYLSNGLSGDFGYLWWIAPIPVLILSLNTNWKQAFFISFFAYLIGRLSWFSYLVMVVTLVPAIIFTIVLPFIFALIILLTRKVIIKTNSWLSVFAFPVFFTTFEFLMIHFSPDGTAASIAYSQANLLPIIQIASLTGILGVTFVITFIPSAVVLSIYYRGQKNKLRNIVVTSSSVLLFVFLFGLIRVQNSSDSNRMKVGLVVLDEKLHDMSQNPDFLKSKTLAVDYAEKISLLARRGAECIVLPERAININKKVENDIIPVFCNAANQNKVWIVLGYTNFRNEKDHNSALVINDKGEIIADYHKVKLIKGLENQFSPGENIGLYNFHESNAGTAICKDLDFPGFIKSYGEHHAGVLFIPAWDFEVDDWLHSRMAILRGVESGFSEIRAARQGRLTISDVYGRVTYEASCSKGKSATLLGDVVLQHRTTLYNRLGDWFGLMNLLTSIFLMIILIVKRNKPAFVESTNV